MKIKLISVFLMILIFWACSSETGNLHGKEKVAPSDLIYSSSSITFIKGDGDQSVTVQSIIEGSSAITKFSLTNPITDSIPIIINVSIIYIHRSLPPQFLLVLLKIVLYLSLIFF